MHQVSAAPVPQIAARLASTEARPALTQAANSHVRRRSAHTPVWTPDCLDPADGARHKPSEPGLSAKTLDLRRRLRYRQSGAINSEFVEE